MQTLEGASSSAEKTQLALLVGGFVDLLRQKGVEVPISATLNYIEALARVDFNVRAQRYWAGRATLITRVEDFKKYHQAFGEYWVGKYESEIPGVDLETTMVFDAEEHDEQTNPNLNSNTGVEVAIRYSRFEQLKDKDFKDYDKNELKELSRLCENLRFRGAQRRSQRLKYSSKPNTTPDLARTIKRAVSNQGELFEQVYKHRTTKPRRVVLLLDISGSMQHYARPLLRFAHASIIARESTEVFSFGTRLTRLSRALKTKDADRALAQVSETTKDWHGGTRLGDSIAEFNERWAARGMARGAVIVVMSDGWDRGDPEVMSQAMQRLDRISYRIIWSNPLKAIEGYAPLTKGMAAALPFVDAFVEGHSLTAMLQLAEEISKETEKH